MKGNTFVGLLENCKFLLILFRLETKNTVHGSFDPLRVSSGNFLKNSAEMLSEKNREKVAQDLSSSKIRVNLRIKICPNFA